MVKKNQPICVSIMNMCFKFLFCCIPINFFKENYYKNMIIFYIYVYITKQ